MAKKAKLFSLEANLLNNGNVGLVWDGVNPDEVEREMNLGMPLYEGSHSVASLIRYLRTVGDEVMEKSRRYV